MNTEEQQKEQVMPLNNQEPNKQQGMEITNDIKNNLQIAGRWSQFLAIVGFVGMGFMVFAGIAMSVVMSFIPNVGTEVFPFPPFLIGLLYIIIALVYLYPLLYLLRFSSGIKQALLQQSQEHLSKAFANLKSHYKTVGIIIIVFLCLYPILMVGMVFLGVFSAMGGANGFPV